MVLFLVTLSPCFLDAVVFCDRVGDITFNHFNTYLDMKITEIITLKSYNAEHIEFELKKNNT